MVVTHNPLGEYGTVSWKTITEDGGTRETKDITQEVPDHEFNSARIRKR